MKRLKINAGGRPLWNDDLERLDEINALLESVIAGRAVLPYVMQGCILGTPTGTVYPVSAGIVFLNGKLFSVDATTLDLSASQYLNTGAPVDSSFRTHEVGTSLACYTETKAEYRVTAPVSGQYLVCTPSGIGVAGDRFWASFATDTELAGEITNRTTADANLQTQINSLLGLLNTDIANLATNYYTKSQVDNRDATTLASANTFANAQDVTTLASANTYANGKFTLTWLEIFNSGTGNILSITKDAFGYVRMRGYVSSAGTGVFSFTLPVGYECGGQLFVKGNGSTQRDVTVTGNTIQVSAGTAGTGVEFQVVPHYFGV